MTDARKCYSCDGVGHFLDTTYNRTGVDVQCGRCHGTGLNDIELRQFVLEAWNRRVDLPVRVKPLVWEKREDGVWADHAFGWYEAFDTDSGIILTQSGVEIGRFNLFSDAKAYAQADHDARIIAALEDASHE